MKVLLIGVLLASPPVAAWMLRGDETALQTGDMQLVSSTTRSSKAGTIQVPIEVVTKGCAPEWVYVEVTHQSVPEPGVVSLMAVASVLLLRRRRTDGK